MASITILPDVIMPSSALSAIASGKNLRGNTRTMTQAGFGKVNIDWARTLREYTLALVPTMPTAWQALEGLFEVTEGGAYGFLMQDPKDCSASGAMLQPLLSGASVGTMGSGYGVPSYQLYKRYTSVGSTRFKDRKIARPMASPVLLRNGAAVTYGGGAGQISVDVTTGIVTFVADASSNVTAITVGATTQVTLTAALAALAVGGRLWLQGLTGADAALLNNQSHAITAITGGASNIYTLATATTGKTITPAGQGAKLPQTTETITWSGGFYVPVNFMNDEIDWDLVRAGPSDSRLMAGPSIVLPEIRE